MVYKTPFVNGIAYTTITTYSKSSFEETLTFYKSLLELNETTVLNDTTVMLANEVTFIIVKLIEDSSKCQNFQVYRKNLIDLRFDRDWRGLAVDSITFTVSSLSIMMQHLMNMNLPFQCSPSITAPTQIYTLDPVGNLIGMTGTKNAISTQLAPPKSPVSSALPSRSSSTRNLNKDLSSHLTTEGDYPSLPPNIDVSDKNKRCIAVMTSGGDAPGMNSNVRAIVRTIIFHNCKPFVVYEGYEGLLHGNIKEVLWEDVRDWNAMGGTLIGTARSPDFKRREGRIQGAHNLINFGIDALIVCGGDGSLTGADIFRSEWPDLIKELLDTNKITEEQYKRHQHLNICGTVGSIDNDMSSTDTTIGAYSALDRICEAVDYVEATAKSHSRAFVIEVMGRNCGWLALMTGISTAADYIFIPETPASSETWREEMCDTVSKHRARNKRTTMVVVAEGAIADDLKPITASDIHETLTKRLGLDTRITTLGHVQRGGSAVAYDRILANLQGVEAVNAVLESTPTSPSPIITVNENKINRKSLVESVRLTKSVAEAIKAKDFKKAMSLRETEFVEHLQNYLAMNRADHYEPKLPSENRLKIAIINIGAPAGGINSAVYSIATYCMSQGHKPYAIYNGWSGLSRHESIRSLKWHDILGWQSRGGSELGTNRDTPSSTDMGMIAYYFQKYQFDGLVLIGGFEAFVSLEQLERARDTFPAFRIPMVLIPATLSNNVPGTEYSLGSDTAMNALMKYCDAVKQSAASTRGRVFVIEVQGGNSGYLATTVSLAVGAQASYVPEEGISLEQLSQDIETIGQSFEKAQGRERFGKIILKTGNASKALGAANLARVIQAESGGKFDAKFAIPGHIQQGGLPSPIDRTKATRYAIRAIGFIEDSQSIICGSRTGDEEFMAYDKKISATASVLGVKGSRITFTSIRKLYDQETDLPNRMPKTIHWEGTRAIADHLVGRKTVGVNGT
ncbi:hypothetical protein KAFR_0F00880 [Kazachstania africana CBS 2517]|uniref:ATP-dependent 6-phosphofructokinase n=1 Tax=Kazachstania africana (strain ATCC 22294 / BCRC 22015 / CBS 2517 / CECT 1963 / NBRC 1671 / NRRL Y-8276) TaxID=1071382 RepID=H2AWD5_KAZAF|nr:hypothetical protein KAFR_0F00880 [Kazachstania africana CBS 2517]CCF58685.1 hypothetical protein KAFR_0F00880 [Kazachstania africana CBS 2517]